MCNGDIILKTLKSMQQKELKCTVNSSCWCMQLTTKFSHLSDSPLCMSPQEMLDQSLVEINPKDKQYLQSLVTMNFIN